MTEFLWSKQREEAAQLVAAGELTDAQIAKKVGVTRNGGVARWKAHPEFQKRVREHVEAWKARFREQGLCVKERRIQRLTGMFEATETIVTERGKELKGTAGGAGTGYIVRDFKGKDADREVFYFDAALVREQRAILEAIAIELGQKTEKHSVSLKTIGSATDEELTTLLNSFHE